MARRPSARREAERIVSNVAKANADGDARVTAIKEFLDSKSPFGVRETDPEFLALLRAEVHELRRRVERVETSAQAATPPKKKGDLGGLVQAVQKIVRARRAVPEATLDSFSRAIQTHEERDWVELILSFGDATPWVDPLRFLIANRHLESAERDRAEAHLRVVAKSLLDIQGFGPADPDEFLGRGDADEELALSLLKLG